MIKIIVDTNIVFSSLLNPANSIAEFLFNSGDCFEFYSPSFLRMEIEKHKGKLLKLSQLKEFELEEIKYIVFDQITFVHEELIPFEIWTESIHILKEIDSNDVPFLALSKYLEAILWTGDLKLQNGLSNKGFDNVYSFAQISMLRDRLRKM